MRLYDDPTRILEGMVPCVDIESRSRKEGTIGVAKEAAHLAFYRDVLRRLVRGKRVRDPGRS